MKVVPIHDLFEARAHGWEDMWFSDNIKGLATSLEIADLRGCADTCRAECSLPIPLEVRFYLNLLPP